MAPPPRLVSRGGARRRSAVVIACTLAAMLGGPMREARHHPILARAATEPASRQALAIPSSPTPLDPSPLVPPPGVRQPVVGGLGALAILVAAAAGFFIYRQIRRGL